MDSDEEMDFTFVPRRWKYLQTVSSLKPGPVSSLTSTLPSSTNSSSPPSLNQLPTEGIQVPETIAKIILSSAKNDSEVRLPFSTASLKMYLAKNYTEIASTGATLVNFGSHERAFEYLNLALSMAPNPLLHMKRAVCYLELGEPGKALSDILFVLKKHSNSAEAYFVLGQALVRLEQYPQAETAFKKVLSLDNNLKDEVKLELIGTIYDALRYYGFDEIKAGFASTRYFSILSAREALEAGAFEENLRITRCIKKRLYKKIQHKKGILMPVNFL